MGVVSIDRGYIEWLGNVRFGEAVAVAVDGLDGFIVVDADVVGLDAHDGSQFLVKLVDRLEAVSSPDDVHQPEVGELCGEGGGNPP